MDLLKSLKNKLYSKISRHVTHATLVEGSLKGTNQPFRCLFVENSDLMGYLSSRIYAKQPIIKRKWRIWVPTLKWILRRKSYAIDMCIAVIPTNYESNFQGIYDFRSQEWVCQTLDVSCSWEEIKKRFHKNPKETARKIRKYGYSYKISHNINDFKLFYNRMYLPLVKKQHGNLSYIDSYEEMEKYFVKGFLLIVMQDDQPISGGLFFIEEDIIVFRRIGVIDGDRNLINKGAQSAVYHFIINFAKKNNLKKVDLMKSRPFFIDGVFRTKREWGASVNLDDESETWIYFFIPHHTEAIVDFFKNNPLVICTEDGLNGAIGWKDPINLTAGLQKELSKRFYSPGLNGLQLIIPDLKKTIKYHFKNKAI